MCRGAGEASRHEGGEEGEEVGLQREMGLVSGISLIVGKTFFSSSWNALCQCSPFLVYHEYWKKGIFKDFVWSGTIVGSGIWQTAGQTMWASG